MKTVINFQFTKNVGNYLLLLGFEGRTRFAEPVILGKKNTIEGLRTNINIIMTNYNRKFT